MEILGHQAATASDKGHRAEIEEIWQQTATAPANLGSTFWASDRTHSRQSIGTSCRVRPVKLAFLESASGGRGDVLVSGRPVCV